MIFDIALTDYRGFHKQNFTQIRPLTILVGENSAGKTSYLAACKYISDFFTGSAEPSFNNDPFQLGTFEQIAHARGGRGGRAKEFLLKARRLVAPRATVNDKVLSRRYVDVSFLFENSDSTAILKSLEMAVGNQNIRFRHGNDRVIIEAKKSGEDWRQIEKTARQFPIFASDPLRFVSLMVRSTGFLSSVLTEPKAEMGETLLSESFGVYVSEFFRSSSIHIRATSAIRTKPNRTYTPGTESEDGEGSHVPYELAKLSRKRNKQEWEEVKNELEKFGTESGMFQEIHVKSFGQTASDPFQLQFASFGPKMNIVDLGYGTSQVLPLLFDSSVAEDPTTFLIQQPEVHLHPRAQAELGQYFVNSFNARNHHYILETHSDFIVDRVRRSIREGVISSNDVSLLFFERRKLENVIHTISLDSEGDPVNPPDTYRQFFLDEQLSLLGLASANSN